MDKTKKKSIGLHIADSGAFILAFGFIYSSIVDLRNPLRGSLDSNLTWVYFCLSIILIIAGLYERRKLGRLTVVVLAILATGALFNILGVPTEKTMIDDTPGAKAYLDNAK